MEYAQQIVCLRKRPTSRYYIKQLYAQLENFEANLNLFLIIIDLEHLLGYSRRGVSDI